MKMKKYILLFTVVILSLTSCSDFLDVSSDSKYQDNFVFTQKTMIQPALVAAYASLLQDGTYGNNYLQTYALNSDVEFSPNSSSIKTADGSGYRWFDGTSSGTALSSTWSAAYQGIERANIVVYGIQNSPIFSASDADLMQWQSEAKVLRAMYYYDMVVLFGDLPFTLEPTWAHKDNLVLEITDRNVILTTLINDLKDAAKYLKYTSDMTEGVERISKEFCYSMIARMSLTRGGYALYPDVNNPSAVGAMKRQPDYLDYYKIARDYADSVITSGKHSLTKGYKDVFVDECNYIVTNNDDPIFEIPFVQGSNGNVGYVHGPNGGTSDNVTTGTNIWGGSSGSLRLNAFYRFSFDKSDLRRDYTIGMWYYDAAGLPWLRVDYYTYCNKWSKFWTNSTKVMGANSSGKTGFNYPYMRYADVLLMFAEAENELNGPTVKAVDALRKVRQRAFAAVDWTNKVETYLSNVSANKSTFFDAIANERKWEFGGENMRWKDLVRWNKYSKVVYDSFAMYYAVGDKGTGNTAPSYVTQEQLDVINALPGNVFFKRASNTNSTYPYVPNSTLQALDIYNLYTDLTSQAPSSYYVTGTTTVQASPQTFYNWVTSDGLVTDYCNYSFRGYVRMGIDANFESMNPLDLPPVRYILPIPKSIIQQSNGKYKNYYGYN